MKIIIEFTTDNAAFEGGGTFEIERILKKIIARIVNGDTDGKIMEISGNSVGSFEVEK